MITAEKIEAISKAKHELTSAKARNSCVMAAKERMKNLLFNYCDDLVNLALENQRLNSEIESLNAALDEADQEYNELKQELKKERAKNAESK